LRVDYSFDGPRLLGTGGALRRALALLDDRFCVLYGDTYLDCDYRAVDLAHRRSGQPALMAVFRNENRWDRSNVVFRDGRIARYSKADRTADMTYIDWGLGVLCASALSSHGQEEAFDLAQRVAVLWGGALQQVGTPEELYERPANRTVAAFVGRANLIAGRLRRAVAGGWEVAFAAGTTGSARELAWPGELAAPLAAGDSAELMLRPESLALVGAAAGEALAGRVLERRYTGAASRFRVAAENGLELELVAPSAAARVDDEVWVAPRGDGPPGRIWAAPDEPSGPEADVEGRP